MTKLAIRLWMDGLNLNVILQLIILHDHNVGDQNMVVLPIVGVDLPCLRKKIRHQNTMLMR